MKRYSKDVVTSLIYLINQLVCFVRFVNSGRVSGRTSTSWTTTTASRARRRTPKTTSRRPASPKSKGKSINETLELKFNRFDFRSQFRREAKDKKYGRGGRKRGLKANTRESSSDTGGGNKRFNGGKPGARGKMGGGGRGAAGKGRGGAGGGKQQRPGKGRRQNMKSKK